MARSQSPDAAATRPAGPHDPGPDAARERAEGVDPVGGAGLVTPRGAVIRFGTASWTDKTLTRAGVFYPRDAKSAEARLQYYASRFSVVEVDSPYYALPARQTVEQWSDRTPETFRFDVKAHALMTGHPSEVVRLPPELRAALPAALAGKQRVYDTDLPADLYDAVWDTFLDALMPLRETDKLGAVLLQYPPWFVPGRESRGRLLDAQRRLGDVPFTVELRNALWFDERSRDRTLGFLREHDMPFVMVDAPQGLASSVPPIVAVTSRRRAVIRFHGRRADTWEKAGVSVEEKFRYLYDARELETWVPRVREAADEAQEVHVLMNNCYANYGTTNATELAAMIRRVYLAR